MKSHAAPARPAARFARILLAAALFLPVGIAAQAETAVAPAIGGVDLENQLQTLILPSIDLSNARIDLVVQLLKMRSTELDPAKKGVNIVLKLDGKTADQIPPVSLHAKQISLLDSLKAVTQLAGLAYRIDGNMVFIEPQ